MGLPSGNDVFRLKIIPARECLFLIYFQLSFMHLDLVCLGGNHASWSRCDRQGSHSRIIMMDDSPIGVTSGSRTVVILNSFKTALTISFEIGE